MGKLTTNFALEEMVHPTIFNTIGDRAADFLNVNLAPTAQFLKEFLTEHLGHNESITVNDWAWGGNFKSSGLRLPAGLVGAKLSAHRFGTAIDCKFKHLTPVEVQDLIMSNQDKFIFISRMENAKVTKTWLHLETCTNKRTGNIKVFNP